MKIGIVSKETHCQAHASALRGDGHEVFVLGAEPKHISSHIDVLVLRLASCSHRASDMARDWQRANEKPLIVEDGLTGIRRGINALSGGSVSSTSLKIKVSTPREPIVKVSAPKEPIVKSPPGFWDEAALPFPSDAVWATGGGGVRVHVLREAADWMSRVWKRAEPHRFENALRSSWRTRLESGTGNYLPSTGGFRETDLKILADISDAKPLRFVVFVMNTLKGEGLPLTYTDLNQAYQELTGKRIGSSAISAAAYITGTVLSRRDKVVGASPEPEVVPEAAEPAAIDLLAEWAQRREAEAASPPEVAEEVSSPVVGEAALLPEPEAGFSPQAEVPEMVPMSLFLMVRNGLEEQILDLMSKVESLTKDLEGVTREMVLFKNHSHETTSSTPSSSDLQTLEEMAQRGAHVELRLSWGRPSPS